ncbi:VOC family protein [Paenarthrobacter sp. PH39-S1]|uniref:VOC family protein n=1 Tax=Paenarthrobacter sp. PH39-S1 TaxID=3046204 RepID=UPI0024BACC97|nr:VOC family protein [Paenarthrobacter sp. PH39-S1]MDJ0355249.1 VOC family protein [Paenarthrobacter sp. PH39-S1]
MNTKLNPYLGFRDTARQAMEFYQSVFGGELTLSTFGDSHASEDPAEQDKIMHGMLVTESGLTLMGADTPGSMSYTPGDNYSVSLSGDDEAELRRFWEGLSAGGTVTMKLEAAPWGDIFGMCTDKFGVSWLVNIAGSTP